MASSFIGYELLASDPGAAARAGMRPSWYGYISVEDVDAAVARIVAAGGMLNDSNAPRPYWLYVFNVADIDAATRRVTASGGTVIAGPHQVPTGNWVTHARDPEAARFAIVGPKH